ncbi:MAG: hypothetical protein NUW37_11255 [Planctomycetes bacterium]|nr:hypothetical protein [Planctomycetota bacterium]
MKSTYDLTIEEGIAIGFKQGIEQGIEKGRLESLVDCARSILDTKFGKEGLKLVSAIRKIEDAAKLKSLQGKLIAAASVKEAREFLSKFK